MKPIPFLMLLAGVLTTIHVSGQVMAIEVPTREPIKDIPVDIRVVVSGVPCEQLLVRTDKGKLEQNGDCSYRFTGTEVGYVKFQAFARKKGQEKLLAEKSILVRPPEMPKNSLYRGRDSLSAGALLASSGMSGSVYLGRGHSENLVTVESYQMLIFRDSMLLQSIMVKGNTFTDTVKQAIRAARPGDHVCFVSILGRHEQGGTVLVPPIEFILLKGSSSNSGVRGRRF